MMNLIRRYNGGSCTLTIIDQLFISSVITCAEPQNSARGPDFLSPQRISKRAVRTSFEKQLDPRGQIASRGGLVPVY